MTLQQKITYSSVNRYTHLHRREAARMSRSQRHAHGKNIYGCAQKQSLRFRCPLRDRTIQHESRKHLR